VAIANEADAVTPNTSMWPENVTAGTSSEPFMTIITVTVT
jgi:hypothetical protein